MTDLPPTPEPDARGPRASDLLLALEVGALIVAGVLIVAWLTDLVPALRDAISLEPLIIAALVVVTVLVLARALRPRRSR